jgi:hypothetical protein
MADVAWVTPMMPSLERNRRNCDHTSVCLLFYWATLEVNVIPILPQLKAHETPCLLHLSLNMLSFLWRLENYTCLMAAFFSAYKFSEIRATRSMHNDKNLQYILGLAQWLTRSIKNLKGKKYNWCHLWKSASIFIILFHKMVSLDISLMHLKPQNWLEAFLMA